MENFNVWFTPLFFSSVPAPEVQQTVNQQVAEIIAWSLDCASAGVAPCRGFKDEPFARHSARFQMAGQKLACGWKNLYCQSINFLFYIWAFKGFENLVSQIYNMPILFPSAI